MAGYYSRNTIQEKKNIRRAYLYIVLSILLVSLMIAFGIALLNNISAVVDDFRGPNRSVFVGDTTPPPPPNFDALPNFTNDSSLKISGRSEPGATVHITVNNKTDEVLINNEGEFNFTTNLEAGENTIRAYTEDASGNQSLNTETSTVILDTTEPDINISQPEDGKQFFGDSQKRLTVRGTTEEGSKVTINGRIARVDSEGGFEYSYDISEGKNDINIKSTDRAGNQSEKTISVNFTP